MPILLSALFCWPGAVRAADTATKRTFDLQAADAVVTLKQFIEQSQEEIIYQPGEVRGVRTNALKGSFTSREALRRLLAGTELDVIESQSGALAVYRKPAAPPSPPARGLGATGTVTGRVQNVVTGQYLNKARLSVRGTSLVTFTDEFGGYQLVGVPSGAQVVEVFYTDLDPQAISLDVPSNGSIERNVDLTSVARYGQGAETIQLNPFLVSSDRETDAQAIANNEQRFAPNIKNVMSTDTLGDVVGGSVGEFLKFIPGLTAEYDNASVAGISIRGIGGAMTSFTSDGAPMVSAGFGGATRTFDTNSMALNDISRIEVTKVPTPATPADSLAGSVNMVSKSAFERSRAQFRYGISLVGNGENLTLRRTPQSYGDKNTRKLNPGVDFDYTLPINKDFGIVVSGLTSNRFNEQRISLKTYQIGGTATGASAASPYLVSHLLADDPRNETRTTLSLKADWRVTRYSVLSFGTQWNQLDTAITHNRLTTNAGTNANPNPSTGVRLTYGDDYTHGATGRGAATLTGQAQRFATKGNTTRLNYRFDDGRWKLETAVSRSASTIERNNPKHGQFYTLTASLTPSVRILFSDVNREYPGEVSALDVNGQPVDLFDLENYRVTTSNDVPYKNRLTMRSGNLNLRRTLEFLPFPSSLQVGGAHRIQTLDKRQTTRTWEYRGVDGNASTFESPTPYKMDIYVNQDAGYGFGKRPSWISSQKAYLAWQENPQLFAQTPTQLGSEMASAIAGSEAIEERVSAFYLQGEATFLNNRLRLLTGVRYERTTDEGVGMLYDPNAVWVRNADGTFARNTAGQRIRKPEAGAAGSPEEVVLTREERAYYAERTYDGFYPSFHLNYDLKENFLLRLAYAKTYGRPNFSDVIPNTTINEADLAEEQVGDPTVVQGTITVRNTNLRPWTADNYDLSLEYYTEQGGLFSAGVFLKEIKDFFGTGVRLATLEDLQEVGLDERYVGWNLSTKFNSGDARITGAEFNVRHSLRALGTWGSYFTVFANATKLKLEGHQQASFTSFVPTSANWGASFSRQQLTVVARWNYRGLDKRVAAPAMGPDAFDYIEARTTLDLSLAYQFSRRLSANISVINIFNVPQVALRYGSQTPDYAKLYSTRNFGVIFSAGIRGSF